MLINLGLGLFALTLAAGALAGADLSPLAHDLAAFFFVVLGAASTIVIAADVILAYLATQRALRDEPGGRLVHHH